MNEKRREFVQFVGATGLCGLAGLVSNPARAELPPETQRIRLVKFPSVCQAPVFVAEELLRAEGFTDISYVDGGVPSGGPRNMQILSDGRADIALHFAAPLVVAIDNGAEISVLGGVHSGCFELFTAPGVRSIKDLKGKTVSVLANESAQHVFLASIAAWVGLDPQRDIQWDFHPAAQGKQLLAEGRVDAYLGFPPDPQELRDRPSAACCSAARSTGPGRSTSAAW